MSFKLFREQSKNISRIYINYMYAFKSEMETDYNRIIINLDDASIHISLSSRKLFNDSDLNV